MKVTQIAPGLHDYVSDRVFDGVRPISPARAEKMVARHKAGNGAKIIAGLQEAVAFSKTGSICPACCGVGCKEEDFGIIGGKPCVDCGGTGHLARAKTGTVADIPDEDLVRRAVRNARAGRNRPRWAGIMDVFGLGSTYASQLCRRFDLDPDEVKR